MALTTLRRAMNPSTSLVRAVIALCAACGGASDGENAVTTDVAVHTTAIVRATLHRYVTAYGYVDPAPVLIGTPSAGALLSPISPGVIAEIRVAEGQRVARGTVLFRLDSRSADVAVQRAERDVAFAEQVAVRQRQLLPSDGTSQRAVQEAEQRLGDAHSGLEAARTARAYLEIAAPIDGTVTGLVARVGQAVDATTVLAKVIDLTRLVVTADVPVGEMDGLVVGERVIFGADSGAPRGRLLVIGREVDPRAGTVRVQATLPRATAFAPGQFTDLRIEAGEHANVFVVPVDAVVTRAGEGSWIVIVESSEAVRKPVTVGFRDGGLVEVAGDGLRAGARVVTIEAYGLPERTKVHVVER